MLTQAVESYLAIRRAVGFELRTEGHLLHSFALFAEARGEQLVCPKTAIDWAGLGSSPPQRARRLGVVIRFAHYLRAEDQRHKIPPEGVFGSQTRPRPVPYIFSPEQIRQVITVASRLNTGDPLLPHAYSTLFGLLLCTGLRVSEAIKLRCQDVTVDGIIVRESKFRKTRLVPLHTTAEAKLERYLVLRQHLAPAADDHLFVSQQGRPLRYSAVAWRFQTILKTIGLDSPPTGRHPTLHSLRHTFAVRALEACPDGRDRVSKHTVALSHYLGHYNVVATYWYLEATANLMNDIAEACDDLVKGEIK
ncbi:MAG: tyrosine-type recombinase/integrase [Deltaproteobacteria bacterium]|nr:tyrosine-type recombinase/integrase [Deltaproteobacteria bacterium]